ncbi:DNA-binding protein WhiA [Pectinatus sottacetonis]|uniref:DNA-binding protein WhiA n=1 Tax=Pectinatus sottacetonis TaxID=1002795 RepID=UPI0018C57CA3|nr:DNA-binding protein WhiA [Pectinatus sottacetonis]
MPSFSAEVKNELAHFNETNICCIRAELSALLRMGASFVLNTKHHMGVNFTTENAAVGRRVLAFIKGLCIGEIRTELVVMRSRRLQKNNHYTIRVMPSKVTNKLLEELGFINGDGSGFNMGKDSALLSKYCCKEAYLRGAFLGGGSVNRPDAGYHLEFSTSNYEFSRQMLNLLNQFGFPIGTTTRKDNYVLYLKESEAIISFLRMIGAEQVLEEFESTRNLKEVRNQVNRLVNCETANLQKTVNAALRQVKNMTLLLKNINISDLPVVLQETAKARIDYPDASLSELAQILGVGKSGVNHRLRKLEMMALQLKECEKK